MSSRWSMTVGLAGALMLASLAWATPAPRGGPEPRARPGAAQAPGWERGYSGPRGGIGPGRQSRAHRLERRRELMAELHLSPAQREKITAIRERQRRSAINQRAEVQIATLDLRKLMRSERPDRAAIDRQIDEIARLRADLRKSQVGAMLDVRSVLTPEQQRKLRERRVGMEG